MSQPLPSQANNKQTEAPNGLSSEISLLRAVTEHIPGAAVFVLNGT